jgi:hypothetical protein
MKWAPIRNAECGMLNESIADYRLTLLNPAFSGACKAGIQQGQDFGFSKH